MNHPAIISTACLVMEVACMAAVFCFLSVGQADIATLYAIMAILFQAKHQYWDAKK